MVKIIVILLSLVFISPSYGATIYHWVDKNGVANFTDDYEQLPSEYRNQIHITVMDDASVMESPIPASIPEAGPPREEARKAIPPQGRELQGGRGRVWETQLKKPRKIKRLRRRIMRENRRNWSSGNMGATNNSNPLF